jgi:hypothetical protein
VILSKCKLTATECGFGNFGSGMGVSEVVYHHYQSGTAESHHLLVLWYFMAWMVVIIPGQQFRGTGIFEKCLC